MTRPESRAPADPPDRVPSLARIFLSFLKLGATSFGGPAMVPYIGRMAVERHRWVDERTFHEGVALCQTVPGATAMQTAAYVGLRTRGIAGAAASYVGFGLPAFLLMVTLSALYVRSRHVPAVVAAFLGLRALIVAIVAGATYAFGRGTLAGWMEVALATLAALSYGFGVNPLVIIGAAAGLGVLLLRRAAAPERGVARLGSPSPTARRALGIAAVVLAALAVLWAADRRLGELAGLMMRIDLMAFGGGYSTLSLMLREVVDVHGWMDAGTFMDGVALGQITPGPIVITATFVGYLVLGPVGSAVATAGVLLPSFLILAATVPYYDRLRESSIVRRAVAGILCSFVGLLVSVTVRFAVGVPWTAGRAVLAAAALTALLAKVDVVWVVLAGAVLAILVG